MRLRKARAAAAAEARRAGVHPAADAPKAAASAAPTGVRRPAPKRESRDDVIDLLSSRGRLTARQVAAARQYGTFWRTAQIAGEAAIRVADLEAVRAGGGGGGYLDGIAYEQAQAAAWIIDCRGRLARAHQALAMHDGMIAVLDLICGRGVRPREITTDQRQSEQIETTLRLALDIVGAVWQRDRASAPQPVAA